MTGEPALLCYGALYMYYIVAVAEIQDHEIDLVLGPFYWFQSLPIFLDTHETEANPIFWTFRIPN